MKMWIARDEETAYCRVFSSKPEKRYSAYYEKSIWTNGKPNDGIQLELYAFPEVTFENSPMEVELVFPSQEPTIGDLLNQLIETKKEMRKFREMVSRMRFLQRESSDESTFDEVDKLYLKCREADVDRWLRETEETEFDD